MLLMLSLFSFKHLNELIIFSNNDISLSVKTLSMFGRVLSAKYLTTSFTSEDAHSFATRETFFC